MGQLVEAKVRQITEEEAAYALREAWKKLYNVYPSIESLALLWSQWALETGRGKSIWCYNFGNIKKNYKPDDGHDWCMFRCSEIINGKNKWFDPPSPQTHFRAYPTMVDGAFDYINFLAKKTRYAKAWEQVKKGNPAAFSHELKVAGYYTANEELYTKGVVKLTEEFKKKADKLLAWAPPVSKPAEPDPITPKEDPKPEPERGSSDEYEVIPPKEPPQEKTISDYIFLIFKSIFELIKNIK